MMVNRFSLSRTTYMVLLVVILITMGSLMHLTINNLGNSEDKNSIGERSSNELEYYGLGETLKKIYKTDRIHISYSRVLYILFEEGNYTKFLMSRKMKNTSWAIVLIEGIVKFDLDIPQYYKNDTSCRLRGVGPTIAVLKAKVLDILYGDKGFKDKEIYILYRGMHYGRNGGITISDLMPILPNKTYVIAIKELIKNVKTTLHYRCDRNGTITVIEHFITYFENAYLIDPINIFLYKNGKLYFLHYDELLKKIDEDYSYLLTHKIDRRSALKYTKDDPLIVNGIDVTTFKQLLGKVFENNP